MNIVMADVQSLNSNLPEPVPEAAPDNDSFTDLMDQHMSQDAELTTQVEYPQGIENKEIFYNADMLSETDIYSLQGFEAPATGLENQVNQNLKIVTEVPIEPISVDISGIEYSMQTDVSDKIAAPVTNPVIGAVLPSNGNALPVLPTQGNSLRQNRSIFIDAPKQVSAGIDVAAAMQSTDLQSMDLASKSSALEIPGLVKTGSAIENINFARGLEFQVANSGIQEMADINNGQIRNLASFNANLSVQPSSSSLPPQLETLTVANPRDSSAWGSGLGERINWMINQKLNTATIRMDPPMLGRLEVHIQLADEVTNVTINTQHGQTRDMIENASYRLREFLQENGYQNVNVDVSHQQEQRQQASEQTGDHMNTESDELSKQDLAAGARGQGNQYFSSDSVVDYFA